MEVNYGTMEYFIDLNKEMISVVLKIFHQWAHTRNRTKYSFIYTNYIVQSIVICCSQEIAFETFIQLSDDFYFFTPQGHSSERNLPGTIEGTFLIKDKIFEIFEKD